MKDNRYRITVEHLEGPNGEPVEQNPLVFETRTHEDLFWIVETMTGKMDLGEADTAAFAVGLKLFSGVMIRNKDQDLFAQFMPHFRDFMMKLKKA